MNSLPKRVICDNCRDQPHGTAHNCYTKMSVINGVRTNLRCECHQCLNYEHPTSLPGQMEEAFNLIGHSMMSEDFAAKLLAFTGVFGSEMCVLHTGMYAGIMIAQEKARIKGGHVPDKRMVIQIQQRIKELEDAEKAYRLILHAERHSRNANKDNPSQIIPDEEKFLVQAVPWLMEIYDKYELADRGSMRKPKKDRAQSVEE